MMTMSISKGVRKSYLCMTFFLVHQIKSNFTNIQ